MRVEVKLLQRRLGITVLFVTHDQVEALSLSDRIAVMHRGRVEQVGPPRCLYEEPASAFVRDFLGQTVILHGRIGRLPSGHAPPVVAVELNGALTGRTLAGRAAPSVALPHGGAAHLAIRPEDIEVAPHDPPRRETNWLPGVIESLSFVGDRYEARVALGGEYHVALFIPRGREWREGERRLRGALVNTFTVTFVRQLLSLPLAVLVAWLLARTDLPGRSWIEFAFWAAFFLPPFTVTLSWILLLDPEYGLVNTWLAKLPFVGGRPFNIYSFWGIVWVHIITGSLTVKVILLTPAFRNMNASFEEASRVAGAGGLRTALRITVPVMAPAILSVLLLGTMVSLQTFEVEQVLGLPFRFFVFSTTIYDLLVTRVPRYDAATALSVVILAAMLPLVLAQQWLTRGRRYTTLTGQFQNQPHRLGRWRAPALALVLALVSIVLGVPVVFALLGTFMKLFGFFHIADPWTLNNWKTVLTDELFLRSLHNTVVLAVGTAVAAVVVHSLIAYIAVRTRYAGRRGLDFISWLSFP